jgi:predicted ABC-type ATPase
MTEGSSRPRLLVVAGSNGAGKTTITERGLAHEWFGGCEYVNPDLVAQELGDWNDPETVLRAARIIDRWARSIANAAAVAAEVDRIYLYDNSVDDRDAELVVRASGGRTVKTHVEPPIWMVPIVQRL